MQFLLIPNQKWKMLHKLLKIPKSECPDIWIRPPRHKWPKSWSSIEDPVVPLERNLYGHPLAGLLWERQFEKILLNYGWEKVSNSDSLHPWPELWKSMGKHAKLKEKQKWSNEKLHLENARKLRGIYFIDPEDKELKETIKNARKKLETPVALDMPCKIMKKNCGSGGSNKIKTKLVCILEAYESTRLRMGNSLPNHHEDHIAGKGDNSLQHYNLVHKFIPMPQALKIPAAKAAVDKEWEKLEKISAWNLTTVRSKKEVIDEARTSGAKVHFASLMDIRHMRNAELEAKHQKYKGRVVLRGDIVKDD